VSQHRGDEGKGRQLELDRPSGCHRDAPSSGDVNHMSSCYIHRMSDSYAACAGPVWSEAAMTILPPVVRETMRQLVLGIRVNASSVAVGNRLTTELQSRLRAIEGLSLHREKEDSESQDAGTVLVAVLAAPAVVALAKEPAIELARGLADWLRKRKATVTIYADGSLKAENVSADVVESIVLHAFERRGPR
jgi:hypothetical protein